MLKGKFKHDIYVATGRYPIDTGHNYTKEEIDDMFELAYPKGTILYLYDDDNAWYLPDGDGGWNAKWKFAKANIEIIEGEEKC